MAGAFFQSLGGLDFYFSSYFPSLFEIIVKSRSRQYLDKRSAVVFDIAVVLHFAAAMVSYNLAGAEAYGQVLAIPYNILILPFWAVYCRERELAVFLKSLEIL